jgi:8-oxo-dGTP pyrophosphatase MutT (NUDIX family)
MKDMYATKASAKDRGSSKWASGGRNLRKKDLYRAKFLSLVELQYSLPPHTTELSWEAVERARAPNRSANEAHGVHIICEITQPSPSAASSLLLVQQYRPAVASDTLELPAGLIDPGESAETAGLRELKEETGVSASLARGSNELLSVSPGSADTLITTIVCTASLDSEENMCFEFEQADGDSGLVKPIFLPLFDDEGAPESDVLSALSKLAQQNKAHVHSELYSLVYGFQLAKLLGRR